jgi:polysaccharide biosynthesis transport protein
MTTELGTAPTVRSYLALARRRKWWIAGPALLGLAVSLALSVTQPNQYSATAQLLVQPSGASTASGGVPAVVTPTQVQTDLQLVTSAPVQQAVSQQLGSNPSVTAAEVAQTDVITITAVSSSPAFAALIANTYANAFVSHQQDDAIKALSAVELQLRAQIRRLSTRITSLKGKDLAARRAALLNQLGVLKAQLAQMRVSGAVTTGGVELVTPALPPGSPSSPKPRQAGLLGLAAGLALGVAAAFLRDSLDDALASKDAAEELGGAPVLALFPMITSWKKRDQPFLVTISQPQSPSAEAYRSLRTSLQFIRQEHALRTLVVTSPAAGEGKTSTAANLGVVFAQAGERVLLVSSDLRRPRIGQFFGLDEEAGLTTMLRGERSLTEVIQPVSGHDTLWLLGSGRLPSNPAELLNGRAARAAFAELNANFDLVIIDTPPVLPVTDAMLLSKDADATLMIVAAGQTKRIELRRATEKLAQVNATVIGTVLTQVTRQAGYDYGYYYKYDYGPGTAGQGRPGLPLAANGSAPTSVISNAPASDDGHAPVSANGSASSAAGEAPGSLSGKHTWSPTGGTPAPWKEGPGYLTGPPRIP